MDSKPFLRSRTSSYMSWMGARTHSTLKRSPSNVKTLWLDSYREARTDFRARAGRGCLWVLAFTWFGGLTAGLVLVFAWASYASSARRNDYLSACMPDDTFSLWPESYNYWSNSGFFEITLGSGRLTFTQAKAIDVIWDIVVARGGQGLLAYLSWQTFMRYVTTSMAIQPVTFNTYRTVFLQNESLIFGIPRIIRDFCKRRALHSRFAMVFIVLTMIFVLVFPTLGGAMTGYSGNVVPRVPDASGNYIPFNNFSIVIYTVHDGERIGLTNDSHITVFKDPDSTYDPVLTDLSKWYQYSRYTRTGYNGQYADCQSRRFEYERSQCVSETRTWNVSTYIGLYGTTPQDTSSTFATQSLQPPTLNISAYDVPPRLNKTLSHDPFPDEYTGYTAMFLQSNALYSQALIQRDGTCQAEKTYQWGFSYIQLTLIMLLLWLWTLGILLMYTISKLTRLQRRTPEVAGEYKAVFELADAMSEHLNPSAVEEGGEVKKMGEGEIRKRMKKLGGGVIGYDIPTPDPGDDSDDDDGGKRGNDWTLKAFVKREKWWLLALALSFVIEGCVINTLVRHGLRGDLWVFPALPLAIAFAMFVGVSGGSRAVVLGWMMMGLCVFPAIVLGVVLGRWGRPA